VPWNCDSQEASSLDKESDRAIKFPVVKNRCSCCIIPDTYPRYLLTRTMCASSAVLTKAPRISFWGRQPGSQNRFEPGNSIRCCRGISGGKDSCYVAYIARKVLNLRVLAVCYDFPFMVELARRNVRMVCSSLGIELKVVKSQKDIENKILRNHLLSLMDTGTTWVNACFVTTASKRSYCMSLSRIKSLHSKRVTDNEVWWNPGNRTQLL